MVYRMLVCTLVVLLLTFHGRKARRLPPPTFANQHPNVFVFETDENGNQQNLILPCPTDTLSHTVNYTWFRGNQELPGSMVNGEGSLFIPNITEGEYASREGVEYHCIARDNIGYNVAIRSRTITVYFAYFNGFEQMAESGEGTVEVFIPVALNSDVALECDVLDAKPPPQIKWYNDQGAIQEMTQGNRVRFLDDGHYLYLRNLQFSHLGRQYYCAVTNVNLSQEILSPTRYVLIDNLPQGVLKDYKQIGTLKAFVGNTSFEFAYVGGVFDSFDISNRTINTLRMNGSLVGNIGNIGRIETLFSPGLIKLEATVRYSSSVAIRNGSLTVNQVPWITSNIQSVQEHYTIEDNLNYSCESEGFPHPRATFYFNGRPISNGTDVSIVNNTLIIPSPQVYHSGIYQCIVSNEFGDDQTAWLLEIRQPISPRVQPYNLTALNASDNQDLGALIVKKSGSTLTFSVDVVADPCPDIVWFFNGTRLGPSNETFIYNNACAEAGASGPNWTFNLNVLLTADTSGSYTACFTNIVGTSQSPIAYFTTPEPISSVNLTINETCLKENSTVSLRCNIRGFPLDPPQIEFQQNGVRITPGSPGFDQYIQKFNDELAIVNVTRCMSAGGRYHCSVSNISDSLQSNIVQLDFCTVPIITRINSTLSPRLGESFKIECAVDGEPLPTVMWMKDGDILNETENVQIKTIPARKVYLVEVSAASMELNGEYRCIATNIAGNTSSPALIMLQQGTSSNVDAIIGGTSAIGVFLLTIVTATLVIIMCFIGKQTRVLWKQCADLPFASSRGRATVVDGFVYFMAESYLVYRYDPLNDKWNILESSLPVRNSGLCQIDGKPVAIGGIRENGEVTNELFMYDETSFEWKPNEYPSAPTARYFASVLSFNEAVVVVGGIDQDDTNTNAVEIFILNKLQWYKAAQIPVPCCDISLTAKGRTCYAIGGHYMDKYSGRTTPFYQALYTSLNDLLASTIVKAKPANITVSAEPADETTDISNDLIWNQLCTTPRSVQSAIVVADRLFFIGGGDPVKVGTDAKEVYEYSENKKCWRHISNLPAPRTDTTVAILSATEFLVIGGFNNGNVKTVYKGTITI